MSESIPALTVRQPWAFAIANGYQPVESRKSATDYRGPVAIYAPAAADEENYDDVADLAGLPLARVIEGAQHRQVIVAVGLLTEICTDWRTCECGEWAEVGYDHWRLEGVVKLHEPVSAMGTYGLWDMPADVKDRVLRQLSLDQLAALFAGRVDLTEEPPPAVTDEAPIVEILPAASKRSPLEIREELLPLPTEGYRRVLLLGTTGAGKTTVIRQLLGTHPETERFPSTSTAKTTVATSELILTDEPNYRAVITFVSRAEIEAALVDNIAETAKACFEDKHEATLVTKLLDHVSQRFRFSYMLGKPVLQVDEDDDWDDDDDEQVISETSTGTDGLVREALDRIGDVTRTVTFDLRAEYAPDMDLPLDDYIEDGLDDRIRMHPVTGDLVGRFMVEIEKRFAQLADGELRRDGTGWPVSWSWQCPSRKRFLEVVTRFSSNQATFFGTLLTPLVDGIRVSGPFKPAWAPDAAKLILIDGEGLGHTPGSVATVSTGIRPRMEEADAILLVDNAQQPMQAAPVAVIKTIATTGNGSKLSFLFTHFDLVKGDNLVGVSAKAQHVRESAENVLNSIREELGTSERLLRSRLDDSTFFVGRIHEHLDPAALDPAKKNGPARYAMKQLNALLDALTYEPPPVEVGPSRPVYDRTQLAEAVREATLAFHREWLGTLGLESNPDAPKRHWATIKALTRRIAGGFTDEYRDLKPAASLLTKLEQQFHLMFQNPARWSGAEPNEEECQYIVDVASTMLTKRLFALTQLLITDQVDAWRRASAESGSGSTMRRAHIIVTEIYDRGVPIPDGIRQAFLNTVQAEFDQVAEELDLILE
ncbi:hypothetical protein [Actinocorallia libanotica]|uniref:hypothetical protein n=1 Tax=Actinocorallia libanotica TaxID=46162 RepID=UPI0031E2F81C